MIRRLWCFYRHRQHHWHGQHIEVFSDHYPGSKLCLVNNTITKGWRWAWCARCRIQFKQRYICTIGEPDGYWMRVRAWDN